MDIYLIEINIKERTIIAIDREGIFINFPLSSLGGPEIKYGKTSCGGHIVQALEKLLHLTYQEGGNRV